jgi:arylsulfatase B
MCGLGKPKHAEFDGMSLTGLINGKMDKLPDRKIVIQYRDFAAPGVVLWRKWRLVHGNELYNLAYDPGQKKDVINEHPEVAKVLKEHYARWREAMTPLQKQVNFVSIGVDAEPVTFLCSANWIGSYADSWHNLLHETKNGYWDIQVEKSGKYEIALYGWPKESGATLSAEFKNDAWGIGRIPSRAVAEAKLKLGDKEMTTKTAPDDMNVVFRVSLKKGERPRLQSWFYDDKGKDLGGSYFVYVTKL